MFCIPFCWFGLVLAVHFFGALTLQILVPEVVVCLNLLCHSAVHHVQMLFIYI